MADPTPAGEAMPMQMADRLPGISGRLRRLAEIAGIANMADAAMALGDANYLDDIVESVSAALQSARLAGYAEGVEAAPRYAVARQVERHLAGQLREISPNDGTIMAIPNAAKIIRAAADALERRPSSLTPPTTEGGET